MSGRPKQYRKGQTYKNPKKIKTDGDGVEGKLVTYIDQRTAYVPLEDNKSMDKEALLIENEMLRETLYAHQNHDYARVISTILDASSHGTSKIIKMADNIDKITKGVISQQEAFRMVYEIMNRKYHLNFEKRPPKTSKLQYAWKMGVLPLVSMHMDILNSTLSNLFTYNYRGALSSFYVQVKKRDKQNKAQRLSPSGRTNVKKAP
jgi:hypothetical protein